MKEQEKDILNPELEDYITRLFPVEDEIVSDMEARASETGMPVIGSLVGQFLKQITLISGAGTVFEMGSGFGYSAYWFAKALGDRGHITCTDYSRENLDNARDYFQKAGFKTGIKYLAGDSLELLSNSRGTFDIIFNDIDKEYYPGVPDLAYSKLNKGGLLITDNVLWHGRVAEDSQLPSTRGVQKYNQRLTEHDGFLTTIIPLRDGLSVSMKLDL